MKYFYFYKITNLINNHFYYGVHFTNNIDDGYMGSGKRLKYAIKKYGIENFKKEILKYFNSENEAFEYESEIVNEELINDINCYNLNKGGHGSWSHKKGKITVKDKEGNIFDIDKNDPKYISGEVISINKGTTTVKDKNGNCFRININDPKYLSGEVISINKGVPKKKESIEKMKNSLKEYYKTHYSHKTIGEDHPFYNMIWVKRNKDSIRIHKEELEEYIKNGWKLGRICGNYKGKIYVHKIENNKFKNKAIYKEELEEYIKNGWVKGQYKPNAKLTYKKTYICKLIDGISISKTINVNELNKYLNNGWIKGRKVKI